VPYSRGDLVARAHEEGEVLHVGHGAEGTVLQARVPPALAAELERFAVTVTPGLDGFPPLNGTPVASAFAGRVAT
jgi:hypothetical protein